MKFAISSLNSEGLTLRWSQSVLAELCHLGCACGREAWNGRSRHASLHAFDYWCLVQDWCGSAQISFLILHILCFTSRREDGPSCRHGVKPPLTHSLFRLSEWVSGFGSDFTLSWHLRPFLRWGQLFNYSVLTILCLSQTARGCRRPILPQASRVYFGQNPATRTLLVAGFLYTLLQVARDLI